MAEALAKERDTTWVELISQARRREKDWRKDARRAQKIYQGDLKDEIPFNVLYSNTETLLPALYSSLPRPLVTRRFKTSDDPVGMLASRAGQRALEFLIDPNDQDYESFTNAIEDCVLDALVPGRGLPRIKYEAEIEGEAGARRVVSETVCMESVAWDRFVIGHAKKWHKVPWIAFYHEIDKKEALRLFGEDVAGAMSFAYMSEAQDDEDKQERRDADGEKKDLARVWEIWDKEEKVIRWVSPDYAYGELKTPDPDPLELSGFFPCPEPLRFLRKSNNLRPGTIYKLYENQATELNRITTRINKVVEALKVRGAYDSTIAELAKVLEQDDNQLVAAEGVAALMEKGGLEKSIWLMPIEKLVNVLQQLYVARENCKRTIYEITGIADIIRGQSNASETLGAQQIKENWATLRLKRMQRDVQKFVRECLRMILEVAASKFSEETFAGMTGMPVVTEEQKQQQLMQAQAAMMAGQPVDPQQMQAIQAQPTWQQLIQILRDDTARAYRIDIETNSTVELDATEDKKDIAAMLGALSQFLSGVAPLVQSGVLPFEAAQAMMLAITRRFNFGQEIEEHIRAMKAPQMPQEGAEAGQKEAEGVKKENEKLQQENASLKQDMEFQKKDQALNQREQQISQKEAALKQQETGMQQQADNNQAQADAKAIANVDKRIAKIEEAVLAMRNHAAAMATTLSKLERAIA